jgi:hypothetical protein
MNVPTVVWDPQGDAEWLDRHFTSASSAPYLTDATGIASRDTAGLGVAIAQALATLDTFHPREWVLGNMTDAICSRKLYEVIMLEAGKAGGPPALSSAIRKQSGTISSAPADVEAAPE